MPVRCSSEWTTTASSDSGVSSPGQPVTSAYRNPWKVNVGSNRVHTAAQDEPVGRLRVTQRAYAELALLQHLRMPDPDLRAARPLHGEPQPAHQVLPEVDQGRPGR